jgi:hypothetical protein
LISKSNKFGLAGKWLDLENIGNYCPKLEYLIQNLLTIQTKSFIYINDIQDFGIDLVITTLKYHGILIMDQSPNS